MLAKGVFDFFKNHLKNINENYLEIGVYNGDGTYGLAVEHTNKTIYCIDPFIEDGYTKHLTKIEKGKELLPQRESALKYFEKCTNIKFFEMTSLEFSNMLTTDNIKEYNISNVFIDGDHSFEGACIDYKLAMKLIDKKEGLIVFDDNNLPGVAGAIDSFLTEYKDRVESVDTTTHNHVTYIRILKNE